MPPSLSDMPEEMQVAFFIYDLLSDRWDGAAGIFLGKDITPIGILYDIYGVDNPELVTTFLMRIQKTNSELINKEMERRRKTESAKYGNKT